MPNDIKLSNASQRALMKNNIDASAYAPNMADYHSIYDMSGLRAEGLAARILRERQYVVMAQMLRTEQWRQIAAMAIECYGCNTQTVLMELPEDDNFEINCPYCQSEDVDAHSVSAFYQQSDFIDWAKEKLLVSKRSIMMRKEYLDRTESMGIDFQTAFGGLVTWGVSWMQLSRKLQQAVEAETIPVEEAQNIMNNYSNFSDASSIHRQKELVERKDKIEAYTLPGTPDFIVTITSPEGEVKSSIYYMAMVPVQKGFAGVNFSLFWNSDFGQMLVRRLKIDGPITYDNRLEFIEEFDLYDRGRESFILLQPLRHFGELILQNMERLRDLKLPGPLQVQKMTNRESASLLGRIVGRIIANNPGFGDVIEGEILAEVEEEN